MQEFFFPRACPFPLSNAILPANSAIPPPYHFSPLPQATAFNCPMEARLMKTRFADLWTQYNYLFYVIDGHKIWHTAKRTLN